MTAATENRRRIAPARVTLLFCVFFLIACGLGYPILNRFDPRQTPGLSDVKTYAALVTGANSFDAGDLRFRRFRVLVPWLARPFYRLARGRLVTWDPVMFGLLVADSLLVAGTALLIMLLGGLLGDSPSNPQRDGATIGLVGALLYMVNFAVPNLRLIGLVDAGEGFFLLALLWSLAEFELWLVPLLMVLGTLTKESFVPFAVVLTSAWWITIRVHREDRETGDRNRLLAAAAWIVVSWLLALATIIGLQAWLAGRLVSPLAFGVALLGGGGYSFADSLRDRNLIYIFLWLLPTALRRIWQLPKSWLMPVAAACVMAFLLDAYFGPAPGTIGRTLFTIAGPVLCLSSASFLLRISP